MKNISLALSLSLSLTKIFQAIRDRKAGRFVSAKDLVLGTPRFYTALGPDFCLATALHTAVIILGLLKALLG